MERMKSKEEIYDTYEHRIMESYRCVKCGTLSLSLSESAMEIVTRALNGESIKGIRDITPVHGTHIFKDKILMSNNEWKDIGTDDFDYLVDCGKEGILIREEIGREEDDTGHQVVTNEYSIHEEFLHSRSQLGRIELIVEGDKCCPVCGEEFLSKRNQLLFFINEPQNCHNNAFELVERYKNSSVAIQKKVENTTFDIKEYLQTLIAVESDIMFMARHLESIYVLQKSTDRDALYERLMAKKLAQQSFDVRIKDLENELSSLPDKYPIEDLDLKPENFGLHCPQKPELKAPGLFNKKKVEAENQQLIDLYRKQLDEYNSEWEKVKDKNTSLIQEKNAKNEALRKEDEDRLTSLIVELTEQKESLTVDLDQSGIQRANDFCLSEIKEVEGQIESLCNVRAQLISLDIIYPKYLDFVALTTICEYFDTGRCSSLTGPDGAYNLYESEIRANIVIAQLDNIIDSLDTIKSNQYKTFSMLTDINNNVANISDKMNLAVSTLESIKDTNEQIAYNSAKTAYYSKVNADYTNAMGYLVALK